MSAIIDPDWSRSRAVAAHATGGNGGGGIVENLQQKFDAIWTAIASLREDMSAIKATLPHLATKAELQAMRSEMHIEFQKLWVALGALETRMIRWFIGTTITLTALVYGLARYTP